jgi:hypothetical protein
MITEKLFPRFTLGRDQDSRRTNPYWIGTRQAAFSGVIDPNQYVTGEFPKINKKKPAAPSFL